jgi:GNS1/SUR4 family
MYYSWTFTGSPVPLIICIAMYLAIVLKIGPELMKNRKPFEILNLIRCYNIYQVISCIIYIYMMHEVGFSYRNTWKCIPDFKSTDFVPKEFTQIFYYHWLFLVLRTSEFLETIFFILRKKNDQVSALHIYHHISTVVLLWVSGIYHIGYMALFVSVTNSLIHVFMYSYYFMSSFQGLRHISDILKKFMTLAQIIQLVLFVGHLSIALLPSCGLSKVYILQIINIAILLGMFVKFYVTKYLSKLKAN